ncbi:hypothetical protein Pint_04127 [Pistacia integerrima]|uniref:Uncharacterized protein n=1 Tax=Pistacia integerrima TaxID=434235 RepID=A0ACC0Z9H6_9ROSI|nr:hypothetical protein Pint_04127 [Pistacia integerrima]
MAFFGKNAVAFLLMTTLFGVSLGAVYKVGDSAGWTAMGSVDYKKWASTKNFHVGDEIVFDYNNKFHNVKEVTHQDFQSCNAASPMATYTTGSDSITLKNHGDHYFLCGVPGHCEAGQKVDIMVTPVSLRPSVVSLGAVYKVGDSAGSTAMGNFDYKKWASTKNFHVGDVIDRGETEQISPLHLAALR